MNRIAIAFAFAAISSAAIAQTDYSKIEVKTTDLGKGVYMLEGAGGNITVGAGSDGVIMVDSSFEPMHDKIVAAIKNISGAPIKYLVDTHYHGDHTGGNAAFAKDGVTLVAQVNLVKRLADPPANALTGQKPAVPPKDGIPAMTFTDTRLLMVKGVTADIAHLLPSHTDGDSYVFFSEANVISTGDVFSSDRYPNIDVAAGGSIDGMIAADDLLLKLANDRTKIVPGHGPLSDRAGLQRFRDMLAKSRELILAEIKAGKTEDQTLADKPLAELDKVWNGGNVNERFVRLVYKSLEK